MTKTLEEVRRELFEARFKNFDLCAYQDEEGDTIYEDDLTQGAWIGFNAALYAVEIQMPGLIGLDQPFTGTPISEIRAHNHYNQALDDCRAAIEQTGLGLRVK